MARNVLPDVLHECEHLRLRRCRPRTPRPSRPSPDQFRSLVAVGSLDQDRGSLEELVPTTHRASSAPARGAQKRHVGCWESRI